MGEGGGGEEKGFSPSALSFFRFHLSPFPQKRLILRLSYLSLSFFIISIDNGQPRFQGEFPVFQYDTMLENEKTLGTRLGHNYEKAIVAPRVLETTLDCLFGFT